MRLTFDQAMNAADKLPYPVPVIVPAHWVNSLGVVRGLALKGIKSITINSDPRGLGNNSIHSFGLISPNLTTQPDEFCEFLLRIGRRLPQKGILFVTDDPALALLSQMREQLSQYFQFTFCEPEIINRITDKLEQVKIAQSLGVPTPRTLALTDDPDAISWPDDAFPAIIKGRQGKQFNKTSHHQAIIVKNRSELTKAIHKYFQIGLIVQEFIPGEDDQVFIPATYTSRAGQMIGGYTSQKLVQEPRTVGVGRIVQSLDCPTILNYHQRVVKAFGFWGVSQSEYKLDSRDNQYKLIEINCRFWLQNWLATKCGQNFPFAAYCDATGNPFDTPEKQINGLRWGNLIEEALRIPNDFRKGQANFAYHRLFHPPFVDGVIDIKDISPCWHMAQIIISSYLTRLKEENHSL